MNKAILLAGLLVIASPVYADVTCVQYPDYVMCVEKSPGEVEPDFIHYRGVKNVYNDTLRLLKSDKPFPNETVIGQVILFDMKVRGPDSSEGTVIYVE